MSARREKHRTLAVIANGSPVGSLVQELRTARITLEYDDRWRNAEAAFPLSLSLPLVRARYEDPAVRPVLAGMLPERPETLARIGREHQIPTDDPFALLAVLGEDCPGAMQFVPPDRIDESKRGSIHWLTERQLADRIRALGTPEAPERLEGDTGYFSLAGQQPKSALRYDDARRRWGVPDGGEPTTHIVKPPLGGRTGYLTAEHLGLALARELELVAAHSFVVRAEDQIALGVRRYDRLHRAGAWLRIHQEDVCQAMGLPPHLKYEKEQGPGIATIVRLLETYSTSAREDVDRFLGAIALNWVMLGTDAHARNYSLLIGEGGAVRLAPFYDMATLLGMVAPRRLHTVLLAMQIGGSYAATSIGRQHWHELADELGRDFGELWELVHQLVKRVPDAVASVAQRERDDGSLPSGEIDALESAITRRARRCLSALG
jgi:serine/threonine-protein kinase HipA